MKKTLIELGGGTTETLAVKENAIPQFADKRTVATMLGMSTRSVDNFLAEGMPHLKLGLRRVRFDLDEVRAWLKEKYGISRRKRA